MPRASAPEEQEGPCGEKGQPDCPLQSFMKHKVKAAQKAGDFEKVAAALEKVSRVAPKGYDKWTSIALSGVKAAKKKDADELKTACKTCHKKYEDRFQEEHRKEKLL